MSLTQNFLMGGTMSQLCPFSRVLYCFNSQSLQFSGLLQPFPGKTQRTENKIGLWTISSVSFELSQLLQVRSITSQQHL